MATPDWALAIAYWLHMISTVLWIGGLAAMTIMLTPTSRDLLGGPDNARLQFKVLKRLDSLVWFGLLVLVGTGMLQMSSHPNYQGFLEIGSRWSAAILLKHLVFLVMVLVSAYLTWVLIPKLGRTILYIPKETPSDIDREEDSQLKNSGKLTRRITVMLAVNLLLGICVLGLTALARVS